MRRIVCGRLWAGPLRDDLGGGTLCERATARREASYSAIPPHRNGVGKSSGCPPALLQGRAAAGQRGRGAGVAVPRTGGLLAELACVPDSSQLCASQGLVVSTPVVPRRCIACASGARKPALALLLLACWSGTSCLATPPSGKPAGRDCYALLALQCLT